MGNLLRADLFRIFKSKLFIVTVIMIFAAPIVFNLLYFGIDMIGYVEALNEDYEYESMFTMKTVFLSCFSLSNNLGIVIPVFSALFVGMDISNGTLRNKVLIGESKTKIFFSHFFATAIFNVVTIVIYTLVTIGASAIFFKYGQTFDGQEFTNLLYWFILGIFNFIFIASVSTALAMSTQSTAPIIIFTVLVGMLLSTITSILSIFIEDSTKYIYYMVPTFILSQISSGGVLGILGIQSNVDSEQFIFGMVSYCLFIAINLVAGFLIFRKKDIK